MRLTTLAVERSTYVVTVSFADENGTAVVPATATWTLTDAAGTVINNRSAVSLAPMAAGKEIVLSDADLSLTGSVPAERVLTILATYTSTLGAGLTFKDEIRFVLTGLATVS